MNFEIEEKYAYLWDGSDLGWALVRAPVLGGSCPNHKRTNAFLLIEDEKENAAVCERMLRHGCEILDESQFKESGDYGETAPPSTPTQPLVTSLMIYAARATRRSNRYLDSWRRILP